VEIMSWEELKYRENLLERQIRGRYSGLLEVVGSRDKPNDIPINPQNATDGGSLGPHVHFIHRTLRDFLEEESISKQFDEQSRGISSFHAICKAIHMYVRTIPEMESWLFALEDFAYYWHSYEAEGTHDNLTMISQFEDALSSRGVEYYWPRKTDLTMDFLSSAIGNGLIKYSLAYIQQNIHATSAEKDLTLPPPWITRWMRRTIFLSLFLYC